MRCTVTQIYFIKYCTCFGQVHCPPSAVSQHCIHSNTYLSCQFCWCLLVWSGTDHTSILTSPVGANRTGMTNTYCCVYSVEILLMVDGGHVQNLETCRVLYQINFGVFIRIGSTSLAKFSEV